MVTRGLLVALALAASAACGGGAPDAPATAQLAVSPGCPDAGTTVRYTEDIVPILDQACIPCHAPGGIGGFDETTYARVQAQESPMLDQVSSFGMPPTNGPVLTAAQRFALTQWLECGAPDD